MSALPYISSEGGPLLVADALALRDWVGCFHGSADYDRACHVVSDVQVGSLDDDRILVWDIEGAGTAFLTGYDACSFRLVRFWTDDDPSDERIMEMTSMATPTGERASVRLTASPAIVVWACEETRRMTLLPDAVAGIPDGDWSMGGTVYSFPVTPGSYSAEVGRYESDAMMILSLICTRVKECEHSVERTARSRSFQNLRCGPPPLTFSLG
jgi:hypothetical protein